MTNRIPPLLVANWKANLPPGKEVLLAEKIANDAGRRGLLPGSLMIAPSALGLVPVASLLQRVHASLQIGLVAQDVSTREVGAHTGETPAAHLLGIAEAVIIGHSERRVLG
ncbi:MAG: triose-phosphate isomerase, partial [Candidatus Limnocylindrus sp.]